MGNIQIMDEWLSNKIAAGEVVERPASVVKELVENAIDAGSTQIEVFLEEAGLARIQVTDNGSGMDEEDAMKSFARHATSKILNEHDLFRIRTLGFRGEALASIASVSKVQLKTFDGTSGIEVLLEGGHIKERHAAPSRRGTDITISQLFFNTPARLKYMKTIQTELGHSIDLMNRLALCNPHIAFKLMHYDQQLLHTNGRGNVQQVLASIYGIQNAKKMIPFEGQSHDYKISGYATLPEITRASKNYMSIFVNGRWVKHFLAQKAIVDAYHTFLPIERFPIVVLFVEGDPYLTDVNVHPAKHQIRLSKEPELMQLIQTTIREAIRAVNRVPEAVKKDKPQRDYSQQMNIFKPSFNTERLQQVSSQFTQQATPKMTEQQREIAQQLYDIPTAPVIEKPVNHQQIAEQVTPIEPLDEAVEVDAAIEPQEVEHFPHVEIVGQIHGTYIVAQMEEGFYLIDQHAAQERIKYEFFRDKVGEVNADERQTLLLPLTFHYAADEALTLREHRSELAQVGVLLEDFGQGSFIVREHPSWFPKGTEQEIIEDLIEQVLRYKKTDIKKLREEAAIMMSCKKSIKANYYLTHEQMETLINDLRNCEHPFTCPHGRPVLINFATYEIEKMFKRVM